MVSTSLPFRLSLAANLGRRALSGLGENGTPRQPFGFMNCANVVIRTTADLVERLSPPQTLNRPRRSTGVTFLSVEERMFDRRLLQPFG
jgi:hypothetical protein